MFLWKKQAISVPHLFVLMIAMFIVGVYFGQYTAPEKVVVKTETIPCPTVGEQLELEAPRHVSMQLPAVNDAGEGVAAYLTATVEDGNGKILVNIGNVLAKADTQESARTAVEVASNYTNIDTSNLDVTFNIVADASILEGPSAGAAMAVSVVAALQDKELKDDVMITGMVNHDFSIGPAGRIVEKAQAAKDAGATLFLVPLTESVEFRDVERCGSYGLYRDYCTVEFVPVNIGDDVGIEIIEVRTLREALGYFLA